VAEETDLIDWKPENIPDVDRLFMRVHRTSTTAGELNPGAFRDREGGMSTEWEKYSTAAEARARAKTPSDNGVISLPAGKVRLIPDMVVSHTPDVERRVRGHTDVVGLKTTEVRVRLSRIAQWEIAVPPKT